MKAIINTKLIDKNGLSLTQGQFDALMSFSYNKIGRAHV